MLWIRCSIETLILISLVLLMVYHEVNCIEERISVGPAEVFIKNPTFYVSAIKEDRYLKGFIVMSGGHRIITTNGQESFVIAGDSDNIPLSGYQEGVGSQAKFNYVVDIVQPEPARIILSDAGNNCLRTINRESNKTETLAGKCTFGGMQDGPAIEAAFNSPSGLVLTGQILYIADTGNSRVRQLDMVEGTVRTLTVVASKPYNILMYQKNVLIISHTSGNILTDITTGLSKITIDSERSFSETFSSFNPGYSDGKLKDAMFRGIRGMTWFKENILLVADSGNGKLRLVNLLSEFVVTVCPDCNCSFKGESLQMLGQVLYAGNFFTREVQMYRIKEKYNDSVCCAHLCGENSECQNLNSIYDCVCTWGTVANSTSCKEPSVDDQAPQKKPLNLIDVIIGTTVGPALLIVVIIIFVYAKRRYWRAHPVQNIHAYSRTDESLQREDPSHSNYNRLGTSTAFFKGKISTELLDTVNKRKIPAESLTMGFAIGKGFYGKVYKARMRVPALDRMVTVAVKSLRDDSLGVKDIENFLREAAVMMDFNHANVLFLIGVVWDDDEVPLLVLPYMKNGDLKTLISQTDVNITVGDVLHFALQVAYGMDYLEKQKYVHRDLAARNCMVNSTGIVKIADFGLSIDVYEREYFRSDSESIPLPIKWMALESVKDGHFSSKSDVWAYGVVLWELMTRGGLPYIAVANVQMKQHLQSGERLDCPALCPECIYDLMKKCWLENPQERPSFAEIVLLISDIFAISKSSTDATATELYAREYTNLIPDDYHVGPDTVYDSLGLYVTSPRELGSSWEIRQPLYVSSARELGSPREITQPLLVNNSTVDIMQVEMTQL